MQRGPQTAFENETTSGIPAKKAANLRLRESVVRAPLLARGRFSRSIRGDLPARGRDGHDARPAVSGSTDGAHGRRRARRALVRDRPERCARLTARAFVFMEW